ncbi:MAG: hypothetical protein IKQ67_01100 [Candidatus Methanomethylophilaceae archaeon]|nr:hypothetical protein [Candidatus Methanomethylophilaceae archaeon]
MTILFVVVVPYITELYIIPFITEAVGDNTFMSIGSQTLIQILIYLVFILFTLMLGGGAILRWFGVFGVLGMIAAYYLLGDVTRAIIPVLSMIVIWIIFIPYRDKKSKKKKGAKD